MVGVIDTLIDDLGGIERAAKVCGVHVSTVRRWRRGAAPFPAAAYRAMLAASRWGRNERAVATLNELQTLHALVDAQRREIAALRCDLERIGRATGGAANQARFISGA